MIYSSQLNLAIGVRVCYLRYFTLLYIPFSMTSWIDSKTFKVFLGCINSFGPYLSNFIQMLSKFIQNHATGSTVTECSIAAASVPALPITND